MKKKCFFLWLLISLILCFGATNLFAASSAKVYVIPVEETIDPGLASFVERGIAEAEKQQVDLILLEIDTPGGRIDAAETITNAIGSTKIPTMAFVKGEAISAGAYITIACPKIAMVPGSTIGAAEPRLSDGSEVDEKIISYWAAEMGTTAEKNGRDREIATAMADRDIEIPGIVEKGKLLTFTYQQAKEHGYADYIVEDRAELLRIVKLDGAEILEGKLSVAEKLTRVVTNPYIAPVLLMLGIAGIAIELFTVGFGIAGLLGLVSLSLYFGGHMMAGFSGWEAILLFLLGFILLAVEAFVPGFGLPGLGGIVSIAASIILAAPSWEVGVMSLVLALVGTIVLVILSFKVLARRKFWDKLILGTKYNKEAGYVPRKEDLSVYIGRRGEALTILRPAGSVILEDGTKLDVVTDGGFIQKGQKIEVVRAEGVSLVVREVN